MISVGELLIREKKSTWYLSSDHTVREALELMADKNIGAVIIKDQEKLAGIFTERDYARKVVLKGKSSMDAKLHEVMTKELITINSNHKIDECMQIMADNLIRHLPVVDNGRSVGIISIRDVTKFMIEEQKYLID
jgi:CBS domain-containing protein